MKTGDLLADSSVPFSAMEKDKDAPSEQDFHREMRKRILEVQRDPKLTPLEKGREIQRLMSSRAVDEGDKAQQSGATDANASPSVTFADEANTIHGCKHYKTHCSIKSNCCGRWFTCRRCHDEQVPAHKINRYATEEMFCFFCSTVQGVGKNCAHCGKEMAKYYCNICKLWSDGDNAHLIFHCDKCGLCRIGPGQYEHCDTCHMCLPPGPHKHMEKSFDANCPICGEYLFTSTRPASVPEPCRHPIHSHCHKKLIKNLHFACPICHKTYADLNMKPQWDYMRSVIANTPIPAEYRSWKVEALCNDCNVKAVVPFHFFGAECTKCGGFNTAITATFRGDGTEVDAQELATQQQNEPVEGESQDGENHAEGEEYDESSEMPDLELADEMDEVSEPDDDDEDDDSDDDDDDQPD